MESKPSHSVHFTQQTKIFIQWFYPCICSVQCSCCGLYLWTFVWTLTFCKLSNPFLWISFVSYPCQHILFNLLSFNTLRQTKIMYCFLRAAPTLSTSADCIFSHFTRTYFWVSAFCEHLGGGGFSQGNVCIKRLTYVLFPAGCPLPPFTLVNITTWFVCIFLWEENNRKGFYHPCCVCTCVQIGMLFYREVGRGRGTPPPLPISQLYFVGFGKQVRPGISPFKQCLAPPLTQFIFVWIFVWTGADCRRHIFLY
jgi:hypothetical protein